MDARTPRPGWRHARWLAVVELAIVVALVVADARRLVVFSKTPFYLVLGWASLRLRGLRWRDVGFALPPGWRKTLVVAALSGVVMELFSAFVSQPLLERLFGKSADLSDLRPLVGNVALLALALVLNWTLAAFGEELVYRGYLTNRVAGLGGGSPAAWVVSLLVVSALFGWGHVDQGLTGQVQAGIDGLLLGALCLAFRRNLFAPVVAHGVSNSLALVLIYLGYYPGI